MNFEIKKDNGRKLASIRRIKEIRPIQDADLIELAIVDGWQVVCQKEQNFKADDLVIYIEIDSRLDKDNVNFSFMEKRNYKVKTIKLRGQLSQGMIFSLSILPKGKWKEGDDVTKILKIEKIQDDYKPDMPNDLKRLNSMKKKFMSFKIIKYMMRYEWFRKVMIKLFVKQKKKNGWPRWVAKTDEERCIREDTLINTNNGSKSIKQVIDDGCKDLILSKNLKENKIEYKKIISYLVEEQNKDWYEIELENGYKLICTGDHKIYINNNYINADKIKIGDECDIIEM